MPFRFGKGDKDRPKEPEDPTPTDDAVEESEPAADEAEAEMEALTEAPPEDAGEEPVEGSPEPAPEGGAPPAVPTRQVIPTQFRRAYMDDETLPSRKERPLPLQRRRSEPRQSDDGRNSARCLFVLVRDDADELASVRQFPQPGDAQAYVELLLEDGTPPEAINVFKATELVFQVTRRPVVKLGPREE